mgnify:CR=1 FL=1
MKILIFGLPGSGKTTLAKPFAELINGVHINADAVEEFFKEMNVHLEETSSIFLRFPNGSSP